MKITKEYDDYVDISTVNNIAKPWFEVFDEKLKEKNIVLKSIKVWEKPNFMATYTDEDVINEDN